MAVSDTGIFENSFLFYGQSYPTTLGNPFKLSRNCLNEQMLRVLHVVYLKKIFEFPLDILFSVIAYLINFAQKN